MKVEGEIVTDEASALTYIERLRARELNNLNVKGERKDTNIADFKAEPASGVFWED